MPVAIITGSSRGLGSALACSLAAEGWGLVLDARHQEALEETAAKIRAVAFEPERIVAIAGDVRDGAHCRSLVAAAKALGGLDLIVNNASLLGPSPQPRLADYPLDALREVYEVNVVGPLALIQDSLETLRRSRDPLVLNITSDASVEPYEGWGGYGSSKAALDHLGAILAAEEPTIRVFTVDPGDMRTQMHQEAFPGEDISDRPLPETVVPALLALLAGDQPSGRYRAGDFAASSNGEAS